MKLIRVGAAVLNQTALDWDGNARNIRAAITAGRASGISILCLPELCIPGYGCEDVHASRGFQRTCIEVLFELLPATRGMIVSFGLPLRHGHDLFNTACLAVDGTIAGFVAKRHLPGDGLHYEPRWFAPWPAGVRAATQIAGTSYPLGDIRFDCGGVRVGFEICEDAWVAERPGLGLAERGVDVILNPSGSHFAFGKLAVRERLVTDGSRDFCAAYVYANLLGNGAGRAIYDGGALIASGGELIAAGPRFSFRDALVTSAVVDVGVGFGENRAQQATPTEHRADAADCVAVPFTFPGLQPQRQRLQRPPWEQSDHLKEEELTRAIALGLFDYLRKSRAQGFVVSLSGGADSSAVACLGAMAVELAQAEIGWEGVLAKLDAIDGLEEVPRETRALVGRLLCCVYQATRNSGEVTRAAAAAVAAALGAEFFCLDVDPLVSGYEKLIADAIGRKLTWETDDITLQNIQARARAPSVWMLANLRGALLLSTSNRSEAAVGYATMDGDTAGGLCPIAGIDKAFLRQWLSWLERDGPADGHAIAALAAVNAQAPTAELRPHGAGQTDEGDLMPYPVLDAIERAAIRDKLTPLEVFSRLRATFIDPSDTVLGAWVERFFLLWCRNQWKRERYAPSFHVDDENLDPKTWCRFPILSGGFARELRELREYLATR